jgi:hypothetical protein
MNEHELKQVIYKYVADHFGESEADDPSWSIEPLAKHISEELAKKTEHNGWSNYATWRVNLELLDAEANAIREDGQVFETVRDLADHLEQMVDDYIEMTSTEMAGDDYNPVLGYCNAFLEDVNYYEIAENMAQDNPEFVKESK